MICNADTGPLTTRDWMLLLVGGVSTGGYAPLVCWAERNSRQLNPNETVYVTKLDVKPDRIHFELITQNVTTLAGGNGTRYRSEVVFRFPKGALETMKPEDVKKTIDPVIADAAIANTVESKTIKIGMGTDQVTKVLGNPDKIVDLGAKQIYVYKDMKVIFKDHQVADVQ